MLRGLVSLLSVLAAAAAAGGPGLLARPLPFFYDLYTFRGDTGTTTVVAAFAVPAGRLEEERAEGDDGVRYRFDVTLVLADTAVHSISRTDDSVFVGFPEPLPDEHVLYTHIEVQAPPSGSTLHRVIMTDATTPGIGQLYGSAFPIPDYGGDALMLSDIALAQPVAEAGWQRGPVTLALLPTTQLPGSMFALYYEIYNLPPGHPYTTEIAVDQVGASGSGRIGDGQSVRIRFAGTSTADRGGMLQELRQLDTLLPVGRYRLTVTVTDDVTGRAARRSRFFQVHDWVWTATPVPALPVRGPIPPTR